MQISDQIQDSYTHEVLVLIGITILYYDYIITVGAEYTCIWRSWRYIRSKTCIFLLLTRYFALLSTIPVAYASFTKSFDASNIASEPKSCLRLAVFHQVVLVITQVMVAVIQFIRTYALYSKQKGIIAFLVCSIMVAIAVNVWAMIVQPGNVLLRRGCNFTLSTPSAIHTALQWEIALAYDALIFLLTVFKAYDWRGYMKCGITGPPNTISLIYRHGAIYFGLIVIAQGANLSTFYILPPSLRGSLSTAASAISVSMMSRLTLDLHNTAMQRQNDLITGPFSGVAHRVEFTSQITVAESDEDAFDDVCLSDSDSLSDA